MRQLPTPAGTGQVRTRADSPIEAGLAVDQDLGRSPDSRFIGFPEALDEQPQAFEPPSQSLWLQWLNDVTPASQMQASIPTRQSRARREPWLAAGSVRPSAFTVAGQWRIRTAFPWPDEESYIPPRGTSQSAKQQEAADLRPRLSRGRIAQHTREPVSRPRIETSRKVRHPGLVSCIQR
jgi:hypothetical protein